MNTQILDGYYYENISTVNLITGNNNNFCKRLSGLLSCTMYLCKYHMMLERSQKLSRGCTFFDRS